MIPPDISTSKYRMKFKLWPLIALNRGDNGWCHHLSHVANVQFTNQKPFPENILTKSTTYQLISYHVSKFKKWKWVIFSMWNLKSMLWVLSNAVCTYAITSRFQILGCQNASKEILLTLLKFYGQILSHSGDIKKFPLGCWYKFTSMKF